MMCSKILPSLALAALFTLMVPATADARLGDSVTVARELARRHGAKSVKLYMSQPYPGSAQARVIAETWIAPEGGWTLDEAASFLKLIVGNKRRLMVKTSKLEMGWAYTFRYQDHVSARCLYEGTHVREISAQSGAYLEADAVEEKTLSFTFD